MVRDFQSKIYNTSVDFKNQTGETLPCEITFSQGDIGTSFIQVNLSNNVAVMDLTGYTVVVNAIRKDMLKVVAESEILNPQRGLIEISVTTPMLCVGMNYLEILVSKDGAQMASPIIPYRVVKSLINGSEEEIPSQNEYPILLGLIKEVQDIKSAYEAISISPDDVTDIINMVK